MKKLIIALVLVLAASLTLGAQPVRNDMLRKVRAAALETLDDYELYSDMHDKSSKIEFENLFQDRSVSVFSDLLEYRPTQDISLTEYIDQVSSRENVSVALKNLRLDSPRLVNRRYFVKVRFDKSITYTRGSVLYASNPHYAADYEMEMDLIYEERENRCRIYSLDGSVNSTAPLLDGHYFVIQKHDATKDPKQAKYDEKLKDGGKTLIFNDFGQAFAISPDFSLGDSDIKVIPKKLEGDETYDYVQLSYKVRHLRIRPQINFGAGSPLRFVKSTDYAAKSSSFEGGVDIGFAFPLGAKAHMAFYTGARANVSTAEFSRDDPFNYSFSLIDSKGKPYTRVYDIESLHEGVRYTDLAIPLYLNLEFDVAKRVRMALDVGAKYYINLKTSVSPYSSVGSVKGVYSAGKVVQVDPAEAFGRIDQSYDSFLLIAKYYAEPMQISVFGMLGADVSVLDWLSVNASVGYEQGLKNIHTGSGATINGFEDPPFIYSSSMNKNIPMRSFMECVSFKRQTVWIGLGLKFRL